MAGRDVLACRQLCKVVYRDRHHDIMFWGEVRAGDMLEANFDALGAPALFNEHRLSGDRVHEVLAPFMPLHVAVVTAPERPGWRMEES